MSTAQVSPVRQLEYEFLGDRFYSSNSHDDDFEMPDQVRQRLRRKIDPDTLSRIKSAVAKMADETALQCCIEDEWMTEIEDEHGKGIRSLTDEELHTVHLGIGFDQFTFDGRAENLYFAAADALVEMVLTLASDVGILRALGRGQQLRLDAQKQEQPLNG